MPTQHYSYVFIGRIIDGNTVSFVVRQMWFGILGLLHISFVKFDKHVDHSGTAGGNLLKWPTKITASWYSCLCVILSLPEGGLNLAAPPTLKMINGSLFLSSFVDWEVQHQGASRFSACWELPSRFTTDFLLMNWIQENCWYTLPQSDYKSLWLLLLTLFHLSFLRKSAIML